jgi:hypothetical protein
MRYIYTLWEHSILSFPRLSSLLLELSSILAVVSSTKKHVCLTTLLVDQGCYRICTTSNNVAHKVVMVVINLE